MTQSRRQDWLDDDAELLGILKSKREDEPSVERLQALEASVLGAVETPNSGDMVGRTGWLAKHGLLAKLVGGAVVVALGVWLAGNMLPRREVPSETRVSPPVAAPSVVGHGTSSLVDAATETQHRAAAEAVAREPDQPSVETPRANAPLRERKRKRARAPRELPSRSPSQLEREVVWVKRMEATVSTQPCETVRLAERYGTAFSTPLLGLERDHWLARARAKLAAEKITCGDHED